MRSTTLDLVTGAGFGVVTIDQPAPFHLCPNERFDKKAYGRLGAEAPTAKQSDALRQDTSDSTLADPPAATSDQRAPFCCTMNVP